MFQEGGRRVKGKPDARKGGSRALAGLLATVLEPGARARGFVRATLLTDWPRIVGPELAGRCLPLRVKFPRGRSRGGTLVIRAGGGTALELRHSSPQLIERINRYLGMPAIARLAFEVGPLPPRQQRSTAPPPPPPSPAALARVERAVATVTPPSLAAALRDLGCEVLRHQKVHARSEATGGHR